MTTLDSNLTGREWGYKIDGRRLYLFELNSDDEWVPPTYSVTNGLKLRYRASDSVFVDSSGFDDNTSPDEDSIVNVKDAYKDVIVFYVLHRINEHMEDFKKSDYYLRRAREVLAKVENAKVPGPWVSIPPRPYRIV